MAHTANWKAVAIPHNQPLPWVIIDLTRWPWIQIPYSPQNLWCLLKAWQEWPGCQGESAASVGSSLYVTVKPSVLFSAHNFRLSPHLNVATHTALLPACFPLPNWSGKAPQVEADTNQEQPWLQISTMSSCRSSRRCPFLSWPSDSQAWITLSRKSGANEISMIALCLSGSVCGIRFHYILKWRQCTMRQRPFYMLIRPCLVVRGSL